MITIGGNRFDERCAMPLILEDRCFLLEYHGDQDMFTVFTLVNGKPVLEILRNEPVENPITKVDADPTGIITVSDLSTVGETAAIRVEYLRPARFADGSKYL